MNSHFLGLDLGKSIGRVSLISLWEQIDFKISPIQIFSSQVNFCEKSSDEILSFFIEPEYKLIRLKFDHLSVIKIN
jgi:hypothetical protein